MQYNPAFDGFRAIAVSIVVAFHCQLPQMKGGFIGVDIFFVLSGFLITTILRTEFKQTGSISFQTFFLNRALRLCPPLFLVLCFYLALAPAMFPGANAWLDASLVALYVSDYARAFWGVPDYLSHTWSLSVEEHFYLIWPFVVLLMGKSSDRRFFTVMLALFLAATGWRIVSYMNLTDWQQTYYRFDTRMSGLILGSAISALPKIKREIPVALLGLAASIVLIQATQLLEWKKPGVLVMGGFLVDLAAAALILSLASASNILARVLSCKLLVYLGLLSYSIYLWHYPISRALRDHFEPLTTFAMVWSISLLLSAISYELVEKPLRAFRKKKRVKPGPATELAS
ncbi:MAG: acyltransferase family protein [Hyphomicrobiales bacterium]